MTIILKLLAIPWYGIADNIIKIVDSFLQKNPRILREKYYDKYHEKLITLRDEFEEKTKDLDSNDKQDYSSSKYALKLKLKAFIFNYRANLYWGRSKLDQYHAAWFNVISAEAYEYCEDWKQAGSFYHFAGHGFRSVEEYRIAANFYKKSALFFVKACNDEMKTRSLQRGLACLKEVGENSGELFNELSKIK